MSDNTLSTAELVQRVKHLEQKESDLPDGLNKDEKSAFADRWEKYVVNTLTATETTLSDEMRKIINRQGFNKNRAENIGRLIGAPELINNKGRPTCEDPVEQVVRSFFYNAEVKPVRWYKEYPNPNYVPFSPVPEESVIRGGTKIIADSALLSTDEVHINKEVVRQIYQQQKKEYDQRHKIYTIKRIRKLRRIDRLTSD